MWTILAAIAGTLALLGALGGAFAVGAVIERQRRPPVVPLEARVASLEVKVEGLPSLWKEERERANRYLGAARAARRSAENRGGEGDESDDVPGGDGSAGIGSGMPAVRHSVAVGPGPQQQTEPDHIRNARAIGWPYL